MFAVLFTLFAFCATDISEVGGKGQERKGKKTITLFPSPVLVSTELQLYAKNNLVSFF